MGWALNRLYISEAAPAVSGIAKTHVQQPSQRLQIDTSVKLPPNLTNYLLWTLGVSVRNFIMSAFKKPQPTMKRIWVIGGCQYE